MLQQMGTLYTEDLSTNSGLNECQCTEATLTQQWNVAIVCSEAKRNRELCLDPISSVSSPFCIRRSLKDQWSQHWFPHSISQPLIRRLHPFVPFSQSVFYHSSTSTCTLAISFLYHRLFLSVARCLYLSDLACTTPRVSQ